MQAALLGHVGRAGAALQKALGGGTWARQGTGPLGCSARCRHWLGWSGLRGPSLVRGRPSDGHVDSRIGGLQAALYVRIDGAGAGAARQERQGIHA